MAFPKKGSRNITVNGIRFRWRVSPYRQLTDWRIDNQGLDPDFLRHAKYYGLGEVADVVFTVVAELAENPKSTFRLKYYGFAVQGFLGPEQFAQIKPGWIAFVLQQSLNLGWEPTKPGTYEGEMFDLSKSSKRSSALKLPDLGKKKDAYFYSGVDYEH